MHNVIRCSMEIHRALSSPTETTYSVTLFRLKEINEWILHVVTAGCTWQDVTHQYGSKQQFIDPVSIPFLSV
ncbi:hypothetical protein MM_1174 [Methanosarcina mazei Go1]|uniref:Uncharacterized protein n=1 Tax=Methanosarcina mazei (strain ATCC BAA-159 / DSM 3647 / Goe1 / Go1 / JCM 11833 / OCM 88) TaxID=192952 RepID=Q8PXP2_METMA|nr:hypothetical protein MM_1174 [Methanosarcina mazei Go1]